MERLVQEKSLSEARGLLVYQIYSVQWLCCLAHTHPLSMSVCGQSDDLCHPQAMFLQFLLRLRFYVPAFQNGIRRLSHCFAYLYPVRTHPDTYHQAALPESGYLRVSICFRALHPVFLLILSLF